MYLFLVLHSLTVVEFQWMSVNVQSILVVSTSRPLQYTLKTDKDWSKWLLCWSGPTWSSTIKVKWVCPIHRGEEDWSCFLVVYVCIWEKMRPLVQKAAIVVCPTQRGGDEVVTHISSQYWQHPGVQSVSLCLSQGTLQDKRCDCQHESRKGRHLKPCHYIVNTCTGWCGPQKTKEWGDVHLYITDTWRHTCAHTLCTNI